MYLSVARCGNLAWPARSQSSIFNNWICASRGPSKGTCSGSRGMDTMNFSISRSFVTFYFPFHRGIYLGNLVMGSTPSTSISSVTWNSSASRTTTLFGYLYFLCLTCFSVCFLGDARTCTNFFYFSFFADFFS